MGPRTKSPWKHDTTGMINRMVGLLWGHGPKARGDNPWPARNVPLGGDSGRGVTIAQPVEDSQPFQAGQWLAVSGLGRKFTQTFQFFRYWWFYDDRWLSRFGALVGRSCPLSRRK